MRTEAPDPSENDSVDQATAWCLRLAESALTSDEQERFDAWLSADDANRQAFDDTARAWRALDEAAATPELVQMRTSALSAFRRGQRARWVRRIQVPRWAVAVSVLGAALLVAGGVWLSNRPLPYQTGVGERHVIVLPDGSRVSLDAETKLDVSYHAHRRELLLERGRAKFTVSKQQDRPFTVAAADKLVRATGTEFSVELLRDEVQVILYEGHVDVTTRTSGSLFTDKDEALVPGRKLVAPVETQTARIVKVDPTRSLSWEGGQLEFVDEPLAAAVERINRYSEQKIWIGDDTAGQVLISGNFTAGDTPAFIEGITAIFPVRVQEKNGQALLVSTRRTTQY